MDDFSQVNVDFDTVEGIGTGHRPEKPSLVVQSFYNAQISVRVPLISPNLLALISLDKVWPRQHLEAPGGNCHLMAHYAPGEGEEGQEAALNRG